MIKVTEEQISVLAPNAAAVSNGKKISQKNGFVKLYRSADDTYLGGECSGSGKSNYITSADFINEAAPVFRCTCPSRQFPCKHSLGLLYDYLAGKSFTECEIPEDITSKREKQTAKKEKKEQESKEPKKINTAALTKKIKKQLEGLTVLDTFIKGVTGQGLASLGGSAQKTYEELAKQMGDYYLPGPQVLMRRLLLLVKQQEAEEKGTGNISSNTENKESGLVEDALFVLMQLRAVAKKGREFLTAKLAKQEVEPEDSMIYESLGMVWQLAQLGELGLKKENARLIQVSFLVIFDEAKAEYADTGYWVDLEDGVISKTENLRPVKAVKYIKQDDTVFDVMNIPALYYYPGEINKRIRFEEFSTENPTTDDFKAIFRLAAEKLPEQLKRVKNQLKNVLSEQSVMALVPYDSIGFIEGCPVLAQGGQNILLKARTEREDTVERMFHMVPKEFHTKQVLAGEYYCDRKNGKLYLMPHVVITEQGIIRLMY